MRSKHRIHPLLLLILAVLTLGLFGLSHTSQVSASEDNPFITSASLKDLTDPTANPYGPIDNMQVTYGYKVPTVALNEQNRDSSITVPEQFTILSDITFDIKDAAGQIVAIGTTDSSSNRINIHYTDLALKKNQNDSISGFLDITLHWNLAKVNTGKSTVINWNLPDRDGTTPNSSTVNVNPSTGPNSGEKLSKWSWYDPADPTILHWCVRVNYARTHVENAVIHDQLGSNQVLTGSFNVKQVRYNADGTTFTVINSEDNPAGFVKDNSTSFHGNLGTIDDTYLIYYESKVTDGGDNKKYSNSVSLNGKNTTPETKDVYSPTYAGGGSADFHGDNTPKKPDVPKVPNYPYTPNKPKYPDTPKTPETPKVPDTPKAPEAPTVPDSPKVPNEPKASDTPTVPDKPKASVTPTTDSKKSTIHTIVPTKNKVIENKESQHEMPETHQRVHSHIMSALLVALSASLAVLVAINKKN